MDTNDKSAYCGGACQKPPYQCGAAATILRPWEHATHLVYCPDRKSYVEIDHRGMPRRSSHDEMSNVHLVEMYWGKEAATRYKRGLKDAQEI